jgi:sugar/nucleoside kinase (ribokinase family)
MAYDIYGIGSPLIDVLGDADEDLIVDLGYKKGGMFLSSDEDIQKILKKIAIIKKMPGDSTANAIVGISNMGGRCAYVGKVGNDSDGELFIKSLTDSGVDSKIVRSKSMTGKVAAMITPDSERTMAVFLGACKELDPQDINKDDIINSKFLHLTGYQLEEPRLKAASLYAIDIAIKNKVKISLDLADANLIKRNLAFLQELARKSFIIFANELEAEAFTGKKPKEALVEISKYSGIAIVKIGSQGSMIKSGENIITIPAFKVNAADTTGAGDMFAAGVLFGLSRNMSLEKCGKIGSFAASKVVEQVGARLSYSLKNMIDDI